MPRWIHRVALAMLAIELVAVAGVVAVKVITAPVDVVLRAAGTADNGGQQTVHVGFTTPDGSGGITNVHPPYVMKKRLRPGAKVDLRVFAGWDGTATCSIEVDGKVVRNVTSHGMWQTARCGTKVPY